MISISLMFKRLYRRIKSRHTMGFSDVTTYDEWKIIKKARKKLKKIGSDYEI